MRDLTLLTMLVLAAGLPAVGRGEEPARPDNSEQIRAWVADLDSDDFRTRDRAMQKLLDAGQSAVAAVAGAIETGGPEVRARGFRILRRAAVSGDKDAGDEVARVLDELSASPEARVARRAEELGRVIRQARQQFAIREIRRLGGKIDLRGGAPYRVQIRQSWKGGDDGLRHLRSLTEVTWLSLEDSTVTDAGLVHLAELKKLRHLYFGRSQVKGPGLVHIKGLTELNHLSLRYMPIEDEWLRHVGEMTQLGSLGLDDTPVTDESLLLLENLSNLRALWLDRSHVSGAGLVHLRPFKNIEKLDLDGLKLTPEDFVHLHHLPGLATLYLGEMPLNDEDLVHLEEIDTLRRLYVRDTNITADGVARFNQAMPRVKVKR